MAIMSSNELTPREYELFNQRKEEFEMQSAHSKEMKQLELEIEKLEAKWSSWLKIPITIVKLPVLILFAIAYICSVFMKQEMPEEFWDFMH